MENELPKKTFLNKLKLPIALFCASLLIIFMLIATLYLIFKNHQTTLTPKNVHQEITFIPASFSVSKVSPVNNSTNVPPGEIEISVALNNTVNSSSDISFSISPKLPDYWKIQNSFPTNNISLQVYGTLDPNTTYTVSVYNYQKKLVYSWHFTTTNQKADNSSQFVRDQADKLQKQFFPLGPYIPYSTNDFYLDYTGRLMLEVDIKNPNISKAQVQQEVNDWIKSHGVDPSTHKINYVNDF